MPWSGGPAGDGRSSCSRDPRRGGEPPSSATFLGGRNCEKRSLGPLRPGTLAGLADWSPEGTEERRAPCNAVYPALPQRGLPSPVLGLGIRTASEASYWKRRSSDPRHLLGSLGTRVCSGRSQWDTLGRGSQAAGWPTKGTSLLRLASGVLRAASSVPWSGGPAGDGRSSCSRDPRRGGEPPSSATFLGGRDWEKRSLETAAPWNTGRVSRLISWGHWGETGTV